MNRTLLIINLLLIFSLNSNCNNGEESVNEPQPPIIETPSVIIQKLPDTIKTKINVDTILTIEDWNNKLVAEAKDDPMIELRYNDQYGKYYNSKAVIQKNTQAQVECIGLFIEPKRNDDTFEIFIHKGKVIDDAINIGKEFVFKFNVEPELLNLIIEDVEKNYSYLAGGKLRGTSYLSHPISINNLYIGLDNILVKTMMENSKSRLSKTGDIKPLNQVNDYEQGDSQKVLLEDKENYVVVEINENLYADVLRDSEGRVIKINSSSSNISYKVTKFIKKLHKIDITEYYDSKEKENLENEKKTKEIIDKYSNKKN
jgi:hypothetical protein